MKAVVPTCNIKTVALKMPELQDAAPLTEEVLCHSSEFQVLLEVQPSVWQTHCSTAELCRHRSLQGKRFSQPAHLLCSSRSFSSLSTP